MSVNKQSSVREINRHIRKYNLISLPATLIIGFGIYLLLTGRGAEFHPWLAETSAVIKLMAVAGVVDVIAMSRLSRLKRLKQVVVGSHKLEQRRGQVC